MKAINIFCAFLFPGIACMLFFWDANVERPAQLRDVVIVGLVVIVSLFILLRRRD